MSIQTAQAPASRHRVVVSAAVAYAIFAALSGGYSLWDYDWPRIFLSSLYALVPLICALPLLGWWIVKDRSLLRPSVEGFSIGIALVFFSDWITRSHNLLQGPAIRGEILVGGALIVMLIRRNSLELLRLLPIIAALLLCISFLWSSNGRILFSDDHATFFYRLTLLKSEFPWIPFYLPLWNAGIDARDFFATGSLNFYFLSLPWLYLFPLEQMYNFLVAGIAFLLCPALMYLAARILGCTQRVAALAAVLSLGSSLTWYRWLLKYGTMGFCISSLLTPLVVVLVAVFLTRGAPLPRWQAILVVLASTLTLFWSLSGVFLLPLVLLSLVRVSYWSRSPRHRLVVAFILCINVPWVAMFWTVSKVGTFLTASQQTTITRDFGLEGGEAPAETLKEFEATLTGDQPPPTAKQRQFRHRGGDVDLRKALSGARDKAVNTNPLILFLTLPGIFLLPSLIRLPMLLLLGWLVMLGTLGVPLKPQLELDRALVVAALIGCLPTAAAIDAILSGQRSRLRSLVQFLVGGFLLATPLAVSGVLWNRSLDQYHFRDPIVDSLSTAIATFGGSGRTVFTGCILHELSHGHLAPLIFSSGKPLVASSHVHDIWTYTQVIPAEFMREGDAGIRRWLQLQNATAVVAHEAEWRNYFTARPEEYRLRWKESRFELFEILNAQQSYFESGRGTIEAQHLNSITVRLETSDATLRFKYFPFLTIRAADGLSRCQIAPEQISPSLQLIRLTGCQSGEQVTIHAVPPWQRFLLGVKEAWDRP